MDDPVAGRNICRAVESREGCEFVFLWYVPHRGSLVWANKKTPAEGPQGLGYVVVGNQLRKGYLFGDTLVAKDTRKMVVLFDCIIN